MSCSRVFAAAIVSIFAVLTIAVSSSADVTITPSILLAHTATYDGKHVTVRGIVESIQERTSRRGNGYDLFRLCDSTCVKVFAWGHSSISEGENLTVRGQFEIIKRVGPYTFHDEIDADSGSL